MSSTTGWTSTTIAGAVGKNQSSNNNSGFNALPEGRRSNDGSFVNESFDAFFWSSTEFSLDTYKARNRKLSYDYGFLNRDYSDKQSGFSVRFVRD